MQMYIMIRNSSEDSEDSEERRRRREGQGEEDACRLRHVAALLRRLCARLEGREARLEGFERLLCVGLNMRETCSIWWERK